MKALTKAAVVALGAAGAVGCPAAKMPSGPPPEYEDPPRPSWLADAAADAASAAEEAEPASSSPADVPDAKTTP